jgi:ABC-2 type transport system permease protein
MFKQIKSILTQDIKNLLRDNIMIYVIIAPLLLSAGLHLALPSFQEQLPSFALHAELPEEVRTEFANYGNTVVLDTEEAVRKRVAANDDIAGITTGNSPRVIVEGNESKAYKDSLKAVLHAVFGEESAVPVQAESAGKETSYLREYAVIVLILVTTLISGMLAGFVIVEDRSTKGYQALAVSPLGIAGYLTAKGILATIACTVSGLLAALIVVGAGISYLQLTAALLLSGSVALIMGCFMGSVADNQINAIGIGKIIFPVFLIPPVLAIFISESWQWLLFPFPNYWMFIALESTFTDLPTTLPYWPALFITAVGGLVVVYFFSRLLKRKLGLR